MHRITQLKFTLVRFLKSNAAAVATEYAFLVAFIAIVAAAGMGILGENLAIFFTDIGQALTDMSGNLPNPFS
jgi:Flp pilus assembly pilin Flp